MSAPESTEPGTRRRDAEATRRAILDAAAEAFCRNGYDAAGVREIAGLAGVDARLITRYFGSKEGLFTEVVDEVYRTPVPMAPGFNHEAALGLLSDTPRQHDGLLLALRSAANERAAEILRRRLEEHYQPDLAGTLPGADATGRAALLISICAGVQLMRNVLGDSVLRGDAAAALVRHLQAALDVVAAGDPEPSDDGAARP